MYFFFCGAVGPLVFRDGKNSVLAPSQSCGDLMQQLLSTLVLERCVLAKGGYEIGVVLFGVFIFESFVFARKEMSVVAASNFHDKQTRELVASKKL